MTVKSNSGSLKQEGQEELPRTEAAVRSFLDEDNVDPNILVTLLEESQPLYNRLGTPAVVRIRGALVLALAKGPIPESALPFLVEELNAPSNAYLTAASAYAIRQSANFCRPSVISALKNALDLIVRRDDIVSLETYGGYSQSGVKTTAADEIRETLGYFSSEVMPNCDAADRVASEMDGRRCCSGKPPLNSKLNAEERTDIYSQLLTVDFVDHNGESVRFDEFFLGHCSIVTFFYTRCDNLYKCPTTISRLGTLQRHLDRFYAHKNTHTAAITYDPKYDSAERLQQYRRSWGAENALKHRLLRTDDGFGTLSAYFDLQVGFGASVVNRHTVESFVLGSDARILHRTSRNLLDVQSLLQVIALN